MMFIMFAYHICVMKRVSSSYSSKVMFIMVVCLLKRSVDVCKINKRYICLVDSITMHKVFNNKIYFAYLSVIETNFNYMITSSEKNDSSLRKSKYILP